MELGDIVHVSGEDVRIIDLGDDGWVRVLYQDGDKVWTPPELVVE